MAQGQATYEKVCAACHATAVAGAPRTGDAAAWQARLTKNGFSGLFDSAIKGKGAMPAKGGNQALSDDEVMSAVIHLLRAAGVGVGAAAPERVAAVEPKSGGAKAEDQANAKGRTIYQGSCAACHAAGVAGAPKAGDKTAWSPRLGAGAAALYASALKGKGAMPAKGGNASLAESDVKAAVDFLIAQAKSGAGATAPKVQPERIVAVANSEVNGKSIYQATCAACHATGVAGAPKAGDAPAWAARTKAGNAALYNSALKGKGAMPAKGGNAGLPDNDVKAAVDFMLAQLGGVSVAKAGAAVKVAEGAAVVAPRAVPPESAAPRVVAPSVSTGNAASEVNAFNRLLQAPGKRNLPPLEDGIHDTANESTVLLQAPLHAYAGLPKSNAGNQIDWVKAINEKKISPRADRQDPKAEMAVLDLNIVREVKGSMPDVVYPHKQHTQWLDCSNCHPSIFIPQKGANQISMASIMLGQKCGVCHGKVAFPISECRLCHSKDKGAATASAGAKP